MTFMMPSPLRCAAAALLLPCIEALSLSIAPVYNEHFDDPSTADSWGQLNGSEPPLAHQTSQDAGGFLRGLIGGTPSAALVFKPEGNWNASNGCRISIEFYTGLTADLWPAGTDIATIKGQVFPNMLIVNTNGTADPNDDWGYYSTGTVAGTRTENVPLSVPQTWDTYEWSIAGTGGSGPPDGWTAWGTPPAGDWGELIANVDEIRFYQGANGVIHHPTDNVVFPAIYNLALVGIDNFLVTPCISSFPEPSLQNLSARGWVGTGDQVLIGGLVIEGTGSKEVLVRARGASLPASIQGRLSDATVKIVNASGAIIAESNDWAAEPQAAEISAAMPTGAPTDPTDAALIMNLPPGAYTAIVEGANGAEGIGIIEFFDLDNDDTAFFRNLSARAHVGTADQVLIGGVIVGGGFGTPLNTVVRGRGPSLDPSVPGRLSDPTVTLFDGLGSALLSVDDWSGASGLGDLAPGSPFDSAFQSSLNLGGYTAILSGQEEGMGIIEFFRLSGPVQ